MQRNLMQLQFRGFGCAEKFSDRIHAFKSSIVFGLAIGRLGDRLSRLTTYHV